MSEPIVTIEGLTVPSVDPNVGSHFFPLTNVRIAEHRIPDIQHVNRGTAPELLAVMNVAYLNLVSFISALRAEGVAAKKKKSEIEAVIILDRAPGILAKKELPSSKDTRNAVVVSDPEYQDALNHVNMIEACLDLLMGKKEAVSMAYNAIKKIIPESSPSLANMQRMLNGHIVQRT